MLQVAISMLMWADICVEYVEVILQKYRKSPKFSDTQKIAIVILTSAQTGLTVGV